jgi:hypothetical protein
MRSQGNLSAFLAIIILGELLATIYMVPKIRQTCPETKAVWLVKQEGHVQHNCGESPGGCAFISRQGQDDNALWTIHAKLKHPEMGADMDDEDIFVDVSKSCKISAVWGATGRDVSETRKFPVRGTRLAPEIDKKFIQ